MTVEITGVVTKVGKVKDYGKIPDWGEYRPSFKYFMEVQSKEHGTILAMVQCDAIDNGYGFKFQVRKDAYGEIKHGDEKPLIGDVVKFTTHRIRENGSKWASVTWNQSLEFVEKSEKAREEIRKFIEMKKEEREQAIEDKKAEEEQRKLDYHLEKLGMRETEQYDERLPLSVRDRMDKTFNWETIFKLIREVSWFSGIEEGEGGKQAEYSSTHT